MKRDYFIDSLRGLMLVIMALDHTPFFTKRYTYQTFGFFGAAIGFIFLSGYVFGFVYSRYLDRTDYLIKKTYQRIWLIYKYHIGLFLFVFLLNYAVSVLLSLGPLNQELSNMYASPASMIKFSFLLNQPGGFDILPLYIFLLLVSPFVLIGFKKGYTSLILISSFIVWFCIQIPIIQQSYGNLQSYLNIDLGYFNVFAWQFLFFIGVYLGFIRNQCIHIVKYNNMRLWIAFSILIVFFLLRQLGYWLGWEFALGIISEREYLIAPRLLNFMVMVYFIGGISKYLQVKNINFLAFLGQHSIDVFVFHIPLIYLISKGTTLLTGLNKPLQLVLALCLVASLIIPAIIRTELRIRKKEERSKRLIDHLLLLTSFPKNLYDFLARIFLNKNNSKMVRSHH